MGCDHQNGGAVIGVWVCGDCWAKLGSRPTRLGMVQIRAEGGRGESRNPIMRQEIVWQAQIATACGFTISQFIDALARRFMSRCADLTLHDASDFALDAARSLEVPFGHADYDWGANGAEELADDEMQNWDAEGGSSNA
jgi:hypothetical protein